MLCRRTLHLIVMTSTLSHRLSFRHPHRETMVMVQPTRWLTRIMGTILVTRLDNSRCISTHFHQQ